MHLSKRRIGALLVSAAALALLALFSTIGANTQMKTETKAVVASAAETATTTAEEQPRSQRFPVVRVVDGDTIVVSINGKETKVRLIGLDTPEVVDPRKPVQCFAREASNKAHELLDGQSVSLEKDPSQGDYDKYGRLLAYMFLPDGTNFNEYMIARGFGHEYTYDLPYKYQKQFKAAEKTAREQKLGLWADDICAGNTKKAAQ